MKKASFVMLSALLLFIGVMIGMIIGRRTIGESIIISYESSSPAEPSQSLTQAVAETRATKKEDIGKVNINTATIAQLVTLPNIGEVLAQRIIDYRTENGPFQTIDDLTLVEGIGFSRLEKLRDDITVGG